MTKSNLVLRQEPRDTSDSKLHPNQDLVVLCKKCRRLRADRASVDDATTFNFAPVSSRAEILDGKHLKWSCTNCGAMVKLLIRKPISADLASDVDLRSISNSLSRSKSRKLKRKLSRVHKNLLATLGMTPELPTLEELENDDQRSEESRSGVTNSSGSLATPSRAMNGEINMLEHDLTEGNEFHDTNGHYVVVEQRSGADDATIPIHRSKSTTSESAPVNPPQSNGASETDNLGSAEPSTSKLFTTKESCSNVTGQPLTPSRSTSETSRDLNTPSPSPSSQFSNDVPMGSAMYKRDAVALYLPLATPDHPNLNSASKKSPSGGSLTKHGSRKKKRSGSWYNVLSPSYKQKNEDFHKFFKTLPDTERLLVDHTCALVKDILIQGRLYVSQNFVCFHSKILKIQTVIQVGFKDITTLTKEKTVKVIPNAIQLQTVSRGKLTFTSFTARDRAYQQIHKLWTNALQDKPMTPQELWRNIRDQYGHYLGCSSDDDYVKPDKHFNYSMEGESVDGKNESYHRGKTKKKNSQQRTGRASNSDITKVSQQNGRIPFDHERLASIIDHSTGDEKSSFSGSMDDRELFDDDDSLPNENGQICEEECEDAGPADHPIPCFKRTYLQKTFNVSVELLFDTIYGANCPFWKNHLSKEATDITVGQWKCDNSQYEGHQVRVLEYILMLSNPLGPKTSKVTETQVWYKESTAGWSYGVDCIAQMHGVPYCDYFTTIMRYCMRKITKDSCELRVSADIKFNKTPWGLVKNFIEKNAYSGIDENFTKLGPELEEYFELQKRHQLRQSSASEPAICTFPRQRLSVASSGDKKRATSEEILQHQINPATAANQHLANGDVRTGAAGNGVVIAAPSTSPLAVPSRDHNNNNGHVTKLSANDHLTRRWRTGAVVFIFSLLIFSNYSLYQRLNSLEEVHASKSSLQFADVGQTKQQNSVYDMVDPKLLSSTERLKLLERRLTSLETAVADHVTAEGERWRHLADNWRELDKKIDVILSKLDETEITT
uniref:GRAM domain-containing protein 1B n=1 Tax=Phallusia mammillata TaxID=59560 RepID=A0A6F9DEM1_9ASCI|nr:GRAM domain-containing protein 1B [Phallusia mammillata]